VSDGLEIHLQGWDPQEFESTTTPQIRIRVGIVDAFYRELETRGAFSHPVKTRERTPWGTKEFGLFDPNRVGIIAHQNLG